MLYVPTEASMVLVSMLKIHREVQQWSRQFCVEQCWCSAEFWRVHCYICRSIYTRLSNGLHYSSRIFFCFLRELICHIGCISADYNHIKICHLQLKWLLTVTTVLRYCRACNVCMSYLRPHNSRFLLKSGYWLFFITLCVACYPPLVFMLSRYWLTKWLIKLCFLKKFRSCAIHSLSVSSIYLSYFDFWGAFPTWTPIRDMPLDSTRGVTGPFDPSFLSAPSKHVLHALTRNILDCTYLMYTPRALFSPTNITKNQTRDGSDDPLQRYGRWKLSRWLPAAIFDLAHPRVAPFHQVLLCVSKLWLTPLNWLTQKQPRCKNLGYIS